MLTKKSRMNNFQYSRNTGDVFYKPGFQISAEFFKFLKTFIKWILESKHITALMPDVKKKKSEP